jgi:hypothetical protein
MLIPPSFLDCALTVVPTACNLQPLLPPFEAALLPGLLSTLHEVHAASYGAAECPPARRRDASPTSASGSLAIDPNLLEHAAPIYSSALFAPTGPSRPDLPQAVEAGHNSRKW